MADVATEKKRPTKPNEEEFQEKLSKLQKEHEGMMKQLNAVKSKLDSTKGGSNGASQNPVQQKQSELKAELKKIKDTQSAKKTSRADLQLRQKQLNESIQAKIDSQKAARSKVPYKSTDEIDKEISKLEKQVDSGMLKLVDERKALADISQLKKQKKNFGQFDESQAAIDKDKASLAELRKQMDDPEVKALSDRFTEIQKELDAIKADQDSVYQNLNGLRDERTKYQNQQQEKFKEIKALKDEYYKSKSEYRDYEQEQWKARQEKKKAERDAYDKERKMKVANQLLEEASNKAYTQEIYICQGLINYFDPENAPKKETGTTSQFAASVGRTVSDQPKGMKVLKKDEEDYFIGGSGKGKKGKKGGAPAAAPATKSIALNMGILEELNKVGINAPMGQEDVPKTVEALKEKMQYYKDNQDKVTEENITKAKAEIAKLEKQEAAASKKSDKPVEQGVADLTVEDEAKEE